MSAFPTREADILKFAHAMSSGLTAHTDFFPAPPVSQADLDKQIAAYYAALDAQAVKVAGSQSGTADKQGTLATIVKTLKANAHYAAGLWPKDDAKLQLIGTGARHTRTPNTLPGQAGTLVVVREGKTWVSFSWTVPPDGGVVSAYRIQRRKTGGDWADIGTAIQPEATLNNQDAGVEFEYQVIAMNAIGDGPASNIVRVVL